MTPEQALIEKLATRIAWLLDPQEAALSEQQIAARTEHAKPIVREVLRALAEAGCTQGMVIAGSLCTQGDSITPRACAVCCFQRMLSALLADEEKQG